MYLIYHVYFVQISCLISKMTKLYRSPGISNNWNKFNVLSVLQQLWCPKMNIKHKTRKAKIYLWLLNKIQSRTGQGVSMIGVATPR